jgi:transcription-repair coupling factor (superfamily II helicase)
MEMYKKISYIRNEADVSDVTDELCDRYGEPPKAVTRLLYVAALRAMASGARIAKVDERDGCVRFQADTPELAVWSELFATHKDLRFATAATSQTPTVLYRVPRGEENVLAAYRLLCEYTAAKNA